MIGARRWDNGSEICTLFPATTPRFRASAVGKIRSLQYVRILELHDADQVP
jgi:hypothetical protein